MLVSKYGERESFLITFNPDYQRTICDNAVECFFGDYPTLATIKAGYGQNMPTMWLIPQLLDLSEYCACRDKLEGKPLEGCAYVISTEYYYLKISELMLFFHRFKSGRYGRFYGSVDPLVITTTIRDFIRERNIEIARHEQEERERREQEYRAAHPPVSREEYLIRKQTKDKPKTNQT